MVDKMHSDNEVDVLLSCRYVIAGRPTAITSLVSAAVASKHQRFYSGTNAIERAHVTDDLCR